MKLSDLKPLVESSSVTIETLMAALDEIFDESQDDTIRLRDLHRDDGKIVIGVESLATETDFFVTVELQADRDGSLKLSYTSDLDISQSQVLASSDSAVVARKILSSISRAVEEHDNQTRDRDDADFL